MSAALANRLAQRAAQPSSTRTFVDRVSVVSCDDFYKPLDACPRFEHGEVRWPSGIMPPAFESRGNADLNHPSAIDWAAVAVALDAAVDAAAAHDAADGQRTLVMLEGLLLFGVGAEAVRRVVCQWFVLDDHPEDAAVQEVRDPVPLPSILLP